MSQFPSNSTPGDETVNVNTTHALSIEHVMQLLARESERARSAERRLAAQQALLDDRLLRIEKNRLFTAWNTAVSWIRDIRSRLDGREADPRRLRSERAAYAAWIANEQAELPDAELAISASHSWRFRPRVSFIVGSGPREDELATLRSISAQWYAEWDLTIETSSAPAASSVGMTTDRLRFMSPSPRAAPPLCDAIAGEYVWVVEPGDLLPPYALYYMVEALQDNRSPLIYADADLHRSGTRIQPQFKPDWSPHLLASVMYIGRSFLIETTWLQQLLAAEPRDSGNWRHDLLVRVDAAGLRAHHVSRVLYHQKVGTPEVARRQNAVRAVRRPGSSGKQVAVVICSRSPGLVAKCLDSLNATAGSLIDQTVVVAHEQEGTDPLLRSAIERGGAIPMPFSGRFNFSLMNNLAARTLGSRHLLFLNDDVTATETGWLECLLEQIEDRGAGVAGATLWYPSGLLQHAGVVSGSGDGVTHVGRHTRGSTLWPWLLETRDVAAVTGACLCVSSALFRALGGFDTSLPNNYNDVDLCFRARAAGHRVVCVAAPRLIHAECASRQGIVLFEERNRFFRKWDVVLSRPDPFYSRHLAPTETIQLDLAGRAGFRAVLAEDE